MKKIKSWQQISGLIWYDLHIPSFILEELDLGWENIDKNVVGLLSHNSQPEIESRENGFKRTSLTQPAIFPDWTMPLENRYGSTTIFQAIDKLLLDRNDDLYFLVLQTDKKTLNSG